MKILKRLFKPALALILCISMVGCTWSQSEFITVLNEVAPAVQTIIEIVALVKGTPASTSISTKIGADTAALEKLYSDFQKAQPADKSSVEGEINAAFLTLQADLSAVFAVAQVSDANTQAKVSALISLIQTAVNIAEAAIPSNKVSVSADKMTAGDLVDSYNKVLVAKTGNKAVDQFTPKHQIHIHSSVVRHLSLGFAH